MKDPHLTDVQLDRLVDGELPDHEYRRLLASLDDEPGGWRRCAQAFLEAQALNRELGDLAQTVGPQRGEARPALAQSRGGSPRWPLLLAMAGSFLLAFTLGIILSGRWPGSTQPVDGPRGVAENAANDEAGGAAGDFDAAEPSDRNSQPWPEIEDRGPAFDVTPPSREPEGVMTLLVEGDGNETRRVEVPFYRYDEREAARWATERPELPADLVRALRRMGHDLRQRRQLLPVDLEDGSQVVFPLDEVEIVPVGGRGYQ